MHGGGWLMIVTQVYVIVVPTGVSTRLPQMLCNLLTAPPQAAMLLSMIRVCELEIETFLLEFALIWQNYSPYP